MLVSGMLTARAVARPIRAIIRVAQAMAVLVAVTNLTRPFDVLRAEFALFPGAVREAA